MNRQELLNMLFLELHAGIDEAASHTIENWGNPEISYPPGASLTNDEINAIANIKLSEEAKSGLRKLLLDACAYPSFKLLSLLDGVTDPEQKEVEEWYGVNISEKTEEDDGDMMHDMFYESYWEYESSNKR